MSTEPQSVDANPPGSLDAGAAEASEAVPRAAPGPAAASALLDAIVAATKPECAAAGRRLERFLAAPRVGEALAEWLGEAVEGDKQQLVRRLNRDVAHIDRLLDDQINAILHQPEFQRLEASCAGLQYLTGRAELEGDPTTKIKVLSLTWKDLERDFERAVEFDQSQLFRKVYEQEFGMPGGEPFGILIADYEIQPAPGPGHPHDDVGVLRSLSQVAAAAFCPVITNASPALFGMDTFDELQHRVDHAQTFSQTKYLKWRSFRDEEDARFIGLTLPRVLMRLPYEDDGSRVDRFQFREDVRGPDRRKYLWGGAAYAMGEVLIRAFAQAGWLADIRGVRRGEEGGGIVTGLPVQCFSTDRMGVAPKCSTDVVVTDELEKQLSDLGFLSLCHCSDTEFSAFYSNQSVQKPKQYDRAIATVNARISSMLQYMLCVSRFAHYVKVLGREKTGSFTEAHEFEDYLQHWIVKYVTADAEARPDVKARRPLREAQVKVHPVLGKPGAYQCTLHLAPHYELDELTASVRLVAELTPGAKPGV